jgi:hypothetical protein
VWFEVEVVEAKGKALVGIAGTNFRDTATVGTSAESWSIFSNTGGTVHARHALHSNPMPRPCTGILLLRCILLHLW